MKFLTLFSLSILMFIGCSRSSDEVILQLIPNTPDTPDTPLVVRSKDAMQKVLLHSDLNKETQKNVTSWKKIEVIQNSEKKKIVLKNSNGDIFTLYPKKAVLVSSILEELEVNNKIQLFNLIQKEYEIYDDNSTLDYKTMCKIKQKLKKGEDND